MEDSMPRTRKQKIGDAAEGIVYVSEVLRGKRKVQRYGANHPGEDLTWEGRDGTLNAEDVKGTAKHTGAQSRLYPKQVQRKKEIERNGGVYIKRDIRVPTAMLGIEETLKDMNKILSHAKTKT
jgi:hypothetical protein